MTKPCRTPTAKPHYTPRGLRADEACATAADWTARLTDVVKERSAAGLIDQRASWEIVGWLDEIETHLS